MSSKRLSRAQRESIIIDFINGKETNESESQIQLPTIQRTKQNARELLRQLSQLLNEDEVESTNEETNKQGQYIAKKHPAWQTNWSRRKLVLQ